MTDGQALTIAKNRKKFTLSNDSHLYPKKIEPFKVNTCYWEVNERFEHSKIRKEDQDPKGQLLYG